MKKQTASANISKPDAEKNMANCIYFLESLGIKIINRKLAADSFYPAFPLNRAVLLLIKKALKFPGDILHEAAHIAIVPAADRNTLDEAAIRKRPDREAEEMMAIAWSYAACIHLKIDPNFVFHDDGYKGGGSYIADNFAEKRYFGLPMLQWKGMALDEAGAARQDLPAYPHMLKWLLD